MRGALGPGGPWPGGPWPGARKGPCPEGGRPLDRAALVGPWPGGAWGALGPGGPWPGGPLARGALGPGGPWPGAPWPGNPGGKPQNHDQPAWTPRQPPGPGIQLPGTRGPPGGGARQTLNPKTLNRPPEPKGLRFGVGLGAGHPLAEY